jgi:predicted ester cyclase
MSVEANKVAVRRNLEDASVATLSNIDALDEVADPDLTVITPGFPTMHGLENVKEHTDPYFSAFSDLRVTIEEMIGEGDSVAGWWTFRITTKVPLPLRGGITVPAGKSLTWTSVGIFRLREGKVVEERAYSDWRDLIRQLDVASTATS